MEETTQGEEALSPQRAARLESALDSERRQREQLERRLQEAERRLERALAAVGKATAGDPALLELKAQLAYESDRAAQRAQLESTLHELEFLANFRAEPAKTAASAGPRTIQYIHVPAPETKPGKAAKAPKDFDDKLAAAQMAIDAAEARASHNALQVRKLTEELAAARAEQLRLAAEMRSLMDRFDGAGRVKASAYPEAVEDAPAPPWEQEPDAAAENASGESALLASADPFDELVAALGDWAGGGSEAPAVAVEESPTDVASEEEDMEDALAAFGAADSSVDAQEAQDLEAALETFGVGEVKVSSEDELAAALEGFGDGAVPERYVHVAASTPEDTDLEAALESWGETPAEPATEAEPAAEVEPEPEADDALDSALEAFGVVEDAPLDDLEPSLEVQGEPEAPPAYEAPRYESETMQYEVSTSLLGSLEVDTLERLDTPESTPEERIAEAFAVETPLDYDSPAEPEPETFTASEPEPEVLVETWEPEAEQDESAVDENTLPVPEPIATWEEPETFAETAPEATFAEEWTPVVVVEGDSADEPASEEEALTLYSATLEALDNAEAARAKAVQELQLPTEEYEPAPVDGVEEDPDPEDAEERQIAEAARASVPVEDFTPDFGSFLRRPAAEDKEPPNAPSSENRKSMVNALRRFAGD